MFPKPGMCVCVCVCACVPCVCALHVCVRVFHVCVCMCARVCPVCVPLCVCVCVCTFEGGLYFRPSHLSIPVLCFEHTTVDRSFLPLLHSATRGDEPDSSIRLTCPSIPVPPWPTCSMASDRSLVTSLGVHFLICKMERKAAPSSPNCPN